MNKLLTFIRQYPVPFIFSLSVLITVGLWLTRSSQEPADTTEKARMVDIMTVKTGILSPSIPVFAQTTTPYHSQLRSSVTADVANLVALEGAIVKQDDLLVMLDDKEALLNVEQRRADVLEVRAQIAAEYNNHENELFVLGDKNKLNKQGLRNRKNIIKEHKIRLDRLNALLVRSQASLKLAELDLERTRIRSPFNGRVTKLHVSVGDRVRPGDVIVEVYDHESMELRGPIPTRYIAALQEALTINQPLTGNLKVNDRTIEVTLDRLAGQINERGGSIDALFKINVPQTDIQLGRTFRLDLKLLPVSDAFAVPLGALYGTDRIYRIVDRRLQAIKVKRLGDFPPLDSIIRVLVHSDDIKDGDVIMVTQLPNAIEGLLVKPSQQ